MSFSRQAENEAVSLLQASRTLIASLESCNATETTAAMASITDAVAIVQRYVDLLSNAIITRDRDELLRAANLLTTVNKGLNDLVATSQEPATPEQGFAVSRQAIALAKQLRSE